MYISVPVRLPSCSFTHRYCPCPPPSFFLLSCSFTHTHTHTHTHTPTASKQGDRSIRQNKFLHSLIRVVVPTHPLTDRRRASPCAGSGSGHAWSQGISVCLCVCCSLFVLFVLFVCLRSWSGERENGGNICGAKARSFERERKEGSGLIRLIS